MNLQVRRIDFQLAKSIIIEHHYSHRMPSAVQHSFGLFESEKIVGVVTFGRPSSPQVARSCVKEELRNRVFELSRLVILTTEKNSASRLVGRSLKLLPTPFVVVSFADRGQNHVGFIYQATNFFFAGESKPHDSEYIVEGKRVHPRTLAARGITNPREWAKNNNIAYVPIEPKYRYIVFSKDIDVSSVLWTLSKNYPKHNPIKLNSSFSLGQKKLMTELFGTDA